MLNFDCTVSGGQVGRQIADDPEEFLEMLVTVLDNEGSDIGFPKDLASYASRDDALRLSQWLRTLANALEIETQP